MRCGGQSGMSILMSTIIIIIAPYCCIEVFDNPGEAAQYQILHL